MKRAFCVAVSTIFLAGLGCGGREFPERTDARDASSGSDQADRPSDISVSDLRSGDQSAGDLPAGDRTAGDLPAGDRTASDLPAVGCHADEHVCNGACAKNVDPTACGVSCVNCTGLPNVKPGSVTCQGGMCVVAPDGCLAGHAHCSASPADVCETDTTKPENCGACGHKCETATPFCANTAGTPTCVLNCGGTTPDKCDTACVDLKTDVNNCGACARVCNIPNAVAACMNGTCVMSKCKDGYGDCTADPGCETQLNSNTNCGACGKSCLVTNGSATCTNATCGPVTCNAGFGNCDNNLDCETPLNTTTNCGKCGTACDASKPLCSTVGGQQTCVNGCSAAAPTRCENACVDTNADLANCGGCGKPCSFPNADATCAGGTCSQGPCKAGFGDCNAAQPGCETPLNTTANCGQCGVSCDVSKPLCSLVNGQQTCVSDCTASAPTKCGTKCVDVKTDLANCGACGTQCDSPANGTSTCSGNSCGFICNTNFQKCGAQCIPNNAQCSGTCMSGLKPCGAACVSTDTCCTNGNPGCSACQVCGAGSCNPQPDGTGCGSSMVCKSGNCGNCSGSGQPCCAGNACGSGLACNAGTCQPACVAGGACTTNPNSSNCVNGVWACASPTATPNCVDDTTKKAAGTDCAGGNVCNTSGGCVTRCAAGGTCTTNSNQQNCINGTVTCSNAWSPATCQDGMQKSAGSSCANGSKVCNSGGACVDKCVANRPCETNDGADSCLNGMTKCQSDLATPECANGGNKAAGSTCLSGTKTCNGQGQCKTNDEDLCQKHADCLSGLCRIRAGDGSIRCSICGTRGQFCCPGATPAMNFCTDGSSCPDPPPPEQQTDPAFLTGFCQ